MANVSAVESRAFKPAHSEHVLQNSTINIELPTIKSIDTIDVYV